MTVSEAPVALITGSGRKRVGNVIARYLAKRGYRIDVLVTTASIWATKTFDEIAAEDLRKNFDVNTLGTFFVAQAVGNVMIALEDGGSIVTVGKWAIECPYLDH